MIDAERDSKPLISVIIPAFNREGTVGRAVASVQGHMTGSYELIVVDDGSSDKTADRAQNVIDELHGGVGRVLRQTNAGPGGARNAGAKVASGRYFAFLDSDDLWYPQTLTACIEALDGPEQPALVFLQTIDITEVHHVKVQECGDLSIRRFEGFLEAVTGAPSTRYGSCNVAVRSDVYEKLGGFTTEVNCSEDTDLFLRAARSGPCFVLNGTPLVAHIEGSGERLTNHFPSVLAGYEFLLARESDGFYPEAVSGTQLRDWMLAQCAAHTVLVAFAAGRVGVAYRLYLRSLPRLLRAGNWHWLIRLPLIPLLAFLRPSSYRMRWTPAN